MRHLVEPSGPAGRKRFQTDSASALRIFFIAATSIWRMRSALTPYSLARSCSVMPPELSSLTFNQRGAFEGEFGGGISPAGRPRLPVRLMVSLLYLKNSFNLSDEELVERWAENVQWQG